MAVKNTKQALKAANHPATNKSRRRIAKYGWRPDLPDQRDYTFAVHPAIAEKARSANGLDDSIDLRSKCPAEIYDQEHIGSCTANAIAGAIEFCRLNQALEDWVPSRLFIYYNERDIEGTVATDSGAMIRDGIKSVANQGACKEDPTWPYDGRPADPDTHVFPPDHLAGQTPSQAAYVEAANNKVLEYRSITQNLADMQGCLSEGFPFVFGFSVYESFESADVAKTGMVPMPRSNEQVIGGHAVLAVGYDDGDRVFICRNSWGPGWGDGGYFYMPYAYLLDDNLSDDFWTIRIVQND